VKEIITVDTISQVTFSGMIPVPFFPIINPKKGEFLT